MGVVLFSNRIVLAMVLLDASVRRRAKSREKSDGSEQSRRATESRVSLTSCPIAEEGPGDRKCQERLDSIRKLQR
jgi:hypothetical protein